MLDQLMYSMALRWGGGSWKSLDALDPRFSVFCPFCILKKFEHFKLFNETIILFLKKI